MRILVALLLITVVHSSELRDIAYIKGGDPLQKLDLYLPEGKAKQAHPVLIAIHGGGWSIGDKANRQFVKPKFDWFLQHGYIVASVNYRLSPNVKHPAHINDVCASIAWIQKNIAKHHGDPKRIHLLGHSAGAHLAALAAVDTTRLKAAGAKPAWIRSAILIDGAGYDVTRQMKTEHRIPRVKEMYVDAFTLDPDLQRDASPVFKLSSKPAPFLILYVAHRQDAKIQSQLLAEALEKHGGQVTTTAIRGKTHTTINRDFGKLGDPVTLAAADFLGIE